MDWHIVQQYATRLIRNSVRTDPTGAHITRYTMYKRLRELSRSWDLPLGLKVLAISHSEGLCDVLALKQPVITALNYPEGDILALPYGDDAFDCLLADQVLEHVKGSPYRAISESFRVVRPGGLVVHTTCFINPIHGSPSDFWRFTPDALRLLCESHGPVIEASGWGNPYVWLAIALGLRFEPVPDAADHALHLLATYNDPAWPIVTWVLGHKQALKR